MIDILIVEDNPLWVDILTKYSQRNNYTTAVAISPQEALDMIEDNTPKLIILDLLLTTETGMALLNEMCGYSDLSQIPIVVCTNLQIDGKVELSKFGVRSILNKTTLTPQEFDATINGILKNE